MQVLLKSRSGAARQVPKRSWEIEVMPPDETAFNSGARAYRCLASWYRTRKARTSQFGA
jgi:hypothetical protein